MTTEQQQFIIGQTVSRAEAEALPVGSVLHAPTAFGSGYDLTKQADGRWDATGGNGRFSTDDLTPDYNTLVRIGGPLTVEVGQTLATPEQIAAVPVDGVIVFRNGTSRYRRTDDGYVNVEAPNHPLTLDLFTDGMYEVQALPSQSEVWTVGQVLTDNDQFNRLPVGTVIVNEEGTEYQMLAANQNRCISNGHVTTNDQRSTRTYTYTIRSLPSESEVSAPRFTVGQPLAAGEPRNLPVGAIVFQTSLPNARYERTADGWHSLTHGGNYDTYIIGDSGAYTLESLPGQPTSESEVPAVLTVIRSYEQMRALPIGSVLVHDGDDPIQITKMDDDVWNSNLGRSGPMSAWRIDGYFRVESIGAGEAPFFVGQRLTTNDQVRALPIGTVLQDNDDRTHTKLEDRSWRYVHSGGATGIRDESGFSPSLVRYTIQSLPSETRDEQGPVFTTGQTITEVAQFEQLPVGAGIVHVSQPNNVYIRTATGYRMGLQSFEFAAFNYGANYYRVVSLPSTFAVGQVVEGVAVRDLPLGTVVSHPETHFNYEHREDGWYSVDAQPGYANDVLVGQPHGPVTIVSLPTSDSEVAQDSGETYDQYVQRFRGSGETYLQYVQRFRVTVYGAAQANSVSVRPLNRGMELLEVPDLPMSPGMFVHYSDESANTRLPVGTVALLEADEDGDFALAGWTGSHWHVLSGCGNIVSRAMKVVSMPGVTVQDWTTRQGTPDDQRRIEEFKNSAAEFGGEAKEDNGWCGVYERTMRLMGINL